MVHGYPLLLDLTNRLIIIVGGGAVAARKAAGVIAAGATRVRCVSPVFCDALPPEVERIVGEYADEHLDGAGLVFAATDRADVNDAVVRDARRRGILVNRADVDETEPGDFSTPARLVAGSVIVTVSAGSPALSAVIRDQLGQSLEPRFVRMADAMRELRPLIRRTISEPARRTAAFRALASDMAMDVLTTGGMDALRKWIGERCPELSP